MENTIGKCLDSLIELDYPKDKMEILIAMGKSDDNTDKIVKKYAEKHKNIVILKNPQGNTSVGRNICIEHSTGDMLMNYSGHAIAEHNLLKILALKLSKLPDEIVSVGCSNVSPEKQNFVGKLAGVVFSSIMGGKNLMKNAFLIIFLLHVIEKNLLKKSVISIQSFGVVKMQNWI